MGLLKLISASVVALIAYQAYLYFHCTIPTLHPSPIVETEDGSIQGTVQVSRDGHTFYQYLGIPYAKPPVRFEPAEPAIPWDGVRKAEYYGHECAQYSILAGKTLGDEDCLFLNVFTPKLPLDNNVTTKFPVMVFVHGGACMFGSGNMYQPHYFMDEQVVLVTLNYRLGSFGFLRSEDNSIRGNMGLKDIILALKWVSRNIASFNGNSNQVTIFGESAGGVFVNQLMLCPSAKGLFHGVIAQSGSATSAGSVKPSPDKQFENFARELNCNKKNANEVVKCLRTVPIEKILEVHSIMGNIFRDQLSIFGPVIEKIADDSAILVDDPRKLICSGKVHKVPIMIGYNSHEGLSMTAELLKNDSVYKTFQQQFTTMAPNFLFYPVNGKSPAQVQQEMIQLKKFYIDTAKDPAEGFTNLVTDFVFAFGAQESAMLHSRYSDAASPVYLYYYSYKGEFQFANLILSSKGQFIPAIDFLLSKIKTWINKYIFHEDPKHMGASHVDELALLFPLEGLSSIITTTDKDYRFSKDLVKLWVSFASGDQPLYFKGHKWIGLEYDKLKHFELSDTTNGFMQENPYTERIEFIKKYAH